WFAKYVISKGIKELTIESRPEFVTQSNINDFKELKLTVGIGLECADNDVLKKYGKGFTVEDFEKAASLLHKNKAKVRAYLMVNIPFGTPETLDKSVAFAKKHSDSIVLINTFPHSKSRLFDLWISGAWSPMSTGEFEKTVAKYAKEKIVETDSQNYMFVPKFPADKRVKIVGASSETLNHAYFRVWQDFFQRFYDVPKDKENVLFLQCSFQKPYSRSNTHKKISGVLKDFAEFRSKTHLVVLSTPGAVPFEYEDYYPFNDYDWPEWEETDEIRAEYRKVVGERIKKYLETHKYKKYYSYLKPSSDTFAALKKACEETKVKLISLVDEKSFELVANEKNPLVRPEMLGALRRKIGEI
ncbi:DUF5591 domain-containing protein, partial [Candidatus Micrarchaeota archaeon]|nr:DUF5591 domain-containing protein [Candidatus Micrarchaeota archaeon]